VDQHWASSLAARAYLNAQRVKEGRTIVQQAVTAISAGGSRLLEAELHRMMGEFLVMDGALDEAEAAFNSAIEIARRQKAKSFELRATISLARLLRDTNRRSDARTMLAEIYNWFTEGFDTADLKDAKAVLDELST
jgi:predicted ATPase